MSTLTQPTIPLPPHPHPHPTPTTLLTSITTSTSLTHLKQIHTQILKTQSSPNHSNSLHYHLLLSSISLPSPSLHYTLSLFSHLHHPPPPPISNKLFRLLSRSNKPGNTLLAYKKVRREGVNVDRFSFPPLLKAAARVSGLSEGMEIHGLASKLGFDKDPFVQTGLVRMYSACGRILEARLVFDKMSHRDVVTWSSMIYGYES